MCKFLFRPLSVLDDVTSFSGRHVWSCNYTSERTKTTPHPLLIQQVVIITTSCGTINHHKVGIMVSVDLFLHLLLFIWLPELRCVLNSSRETERAFAITCHHHPRPCLECHRQETFSCQTLRAWSGAGAGKWLLGQMALIEWRASFCQSIPPSPGWVLESWVVSCVWVASCDVSDVDMCHFRAGEPHAAAQWHHGGCGGHLAG